jgi:hypothetical protein
MCVNTGDGPASDLCVTEIGSTAPTLVQVTRRLRAVLEELRASVRPERRGAVEMELGELGCERRGELPADAAFAGGGDRGGNGGPA